MRPDRLVVGEVRGAEAFDMLQALNTGHDGSVSTVHANSPTDALARLETLVLLAGIALPLAAVRAQVSSAVDAIVQVARNRGGARSVVAVAEVAAAVGADAEAPRARFLLVRDRGPLVAIEPPTRPARRAGFDLEEAWCRCARSSSR
jgi:Flp pilus assembly CpaF family ATPase